MSAFKLFWHYNHSGDKERDAYHLPFKDDDKVFNFFASPGIYGRELLPKEIIFQANFNLILLFDFPLTDLQIPVMHQRMFDILIEVMRLEESKN